MKLPRLILPEKHQVADLLLNGATYLLNRHLADVFVSTQC